MDKYDSDNYPILPKILFVIPYIYIIHIHISNPLILIYQLMQVNIYTNRSAQVQQNVGIYLITRAKIKLFRKIVRVYEA